MKKVILGMIVAVMAMVAQCATVSWNLTNVMTPADATIKSTGYAVYVFATADTTSTWTTTTTDAIVAAITDGSFSADSAMSSATTTNGGAAKTGLGDFGAGDSISAFAVIFDAASYADADNYIVTAVKSQSYTSSTGSKSLAFGSQASASWTAVPGTGAPEPTSAILILLGMAGLALKRKIA